MAIRKDVVWPWLSPLEKKFLNTAQPDADETRSLVWRIESAWVLLWALGHVDVLDWPVAYCNTDHFARTMVLAARDPSKFEQSSKLQNISQIVDARAMTMRIHWAVTDAYLNHRQIPANLDWLHPTEMINAAPTLIGRLVEERHRAFNWLLRQFGEDWDEIEIHT